MNGIGQNLTKKLISHLGEQVRTIGFLLHSDLKSARTFELSSEISGFIGP